MRNCKKNGFTLIELLLVVAILGVIAALVIPRIGDSLKESRKSTCQKNVANIKAQLELYKSKSTVTPSYPADQTEFDSTSFLGNKLWFSGVPKCPKGGAYSYTRVAGPPEDYVLSCPDTTEPHQ